MKPFGPDLHVVFVEPEIPPNTGTTARLCAATESTLHLVGPLGFSLEDRYLRRAGLDYWPHVRMHFHESWEVFAAVHGSERLHLFSARAVRTYTKVRYEAGDFLVFGGETHGLSTQVTAGRQESLVTIPMVGRAVRSLNLANAAAIGLYEALRQTAPD